jgi:hypothetical protein
MPLSPSCMLPAFCHYTWPSPLLVESHLYNAVLKRQKYVRACTRRQLTELTYQNGAWRAGAARRSGPHWKRLECRFQETSPTLTLRRILRASARLTSLYVGIYINGAVLNLLRFWRVLGPGSYHDQHTRRYESRAAVDNVAISESPAAKMREGWHLPLRSSSA